MPASGSSRPYQFGRSGSSIDRVLPIETILHDLVDLLAVATSARDRGRRLRMPRAELPEISLPQIVPCRAIEKRKNKSVNLRLPEQLLKAVQEQAKRAGIPYQRFIHMALERAFQQGPR